jgi:hypothetical protein
VRAEHARIERELSEQIADLATGLMARDSEIATLRQQLVRAEKIARKARKGETTSGQHAAVPEELQQRLRTLEQERDAARVEYQRRADDIERGYTERLIALARADGSQVMFALSERVVALQNAAARSDARSGSESLEAEIEALRSENEFLLAEIERSARGKE